jgi:hypothetical protein
MRGARTRRTGAKGKATSQASRHLKWKKEEDELLEQLVAIEGTRDWATISEQMEGRNPRQCKERWDNYLRRDLRHTEWTQEEDMLLFKKHEELGSKWVHIARFFPNRTDAMVKTRFNLINRHEQKRIKMLREQTALLQIFQVQPPMPIIRPEDQFQDTAAFDTFGDSSDWDCGFTEPSGLDFFDFA